MGYFKVVSRTAFVFVLLRNRLFPFALFRVVSLGGLLERGGAGGTHARGKMIGTEISFVSETL